MSFLKQHRATPFLDTISKSAE